MGFRRVILPQKNEKALYADQGIELIGVSTVEEALTAAFGGVASDGR